MHFGTSLKLSVLLLLSASTLACTAAAATPAPKPKSTPAKTTSTAVKVAKPPAAEVVETYIDVNPEELVDKPQEYLNKGVKFTAKFFAFSSLALDYKPAFRSSKSYLSFLILRPHSHVPLSELKLALPIPKEKDPENQLITVLKDGDVIELSGRIFSTALGDPWMDVQHIKKIGGSEKTEKTADADSEAGKTAEPSAKQDTKPESTKP